MSEVRDYIESGILELYSLGVLEPVERREVEVMAARHPEVDAALQDLAGLMEVGLEQAANHAPTAFKADFLSALDEDSRFPAGRPEPLHKGSRLEDYHPWVEAADLSALASERNVTLIPLYEDEAMSMYYGQVRRGLREEVHHDELEKILVLDGHCDIFFAGAVRHYGKDDFIHVPMHVPHEVTITSTEPCVMLLQRWKV